MTTTSAKAKVAKSLLKCDDILFPPVLILIPPISDIAEAS